MIILVLFLKLYSIVLPYEKFSGFNFQFLQKPEYNRVPVIGI